MTNKLAAIAFAAVTTLAVGCGSGSNNNGGDDLGSGGAGGGGGGGGSGPSDMAGVVPCVCPTGFSCDPSGVCVGGNDTAIGVDVKTVNVAGTVTLNGAAPSTLPSCNPSPSTAKASVQLVDTARGYHFELPVPCSASTFSWSGVVFPGSYKVFVTGDSNYSSLPTQSFLANGELDVSSDAMSVALDVKTASVGGTITLNGAAPTTTAACTGNAGVAKATVHLVDNADGYRFDLDVPCSSTTFQWGGVVFPGTYTVSVDGDGRYSNVPATAFIANSALVVSGSAANQALDIKTVHAAGTVTLNGLVPTSTCPSSTTYSKAVVHLSDSKHGYQFDFPITCAQSDYAWSGDVYPGTYALTVDGGDGYSNLPRTPYVGNAALAITHDVTGQAINVQTFTVGGTVTLNGSAPATDPACTQDPSAQKAVVRLTDAKHGYAFDLPVLCSSSSFAWSGQVFPGTYTVSVGGGNYSNLPDQPFVANSALVVTSNVTGQALDVKTAAVGGSLTLNGAAPSTTTACNPNPTATKANVEFVDPVSGYAFAVPVACSAANFAWSGVVYPGTYRISVAGAGGYSNLPSEGFLVTPRLKVQ